MHARSVRVTPATEPISIDALPLHAHYSCHGVTKSDFSPFRGGILATESADAPFRNSVTITESAKPLEFQRFDDNAPIISQQALVTQSPKLHSAHSVTSNCATERHNHAFSRSVAAFPHVIRVGHHAMMNPVNRHTHRGLSRHSNTCGGQPGSSRTSFMTDTGHISWDCPERETTVSGQHHRVDATVGLPHSVAEVCAIVLCPIQPCEPFVAFIDGELQKVVSQFVNQIEGLLPAQPAR